LFSRLHNIHSGAWSRTKQFIVCLGVGFLCLMLGYVADITFLQKKLYHVRQQKEEAIQRLQSKPQEPKAEQQKIEILREQYITKLKRFVGVFDLADILTGLEKASVNSQVELHAVEPQAAKEEGAFVVYPVRLDLCGQYKNLLGFINDMFKQPYFTVFKEVTLQKKIASEEGDELSMQALILVYENKKPREKHTDSNASFTRGAVIGLPGRDLFTKTTSEVNLFLWSSKELSFLGLMKQNMRIYGFVADPLGGVHRVVVGDKIGLKQSKIVAIGESGIVAADKANNIPFVY
jgi:Tfp pilus assembly protein PilO